MADRKPYATPRLFERVVHLEGPEGFGVALCDKNATGIIVSQDDKLVSCPACCELLAAAVAARAAELRAGAS